MGGVIIKNSFKDFLNYIDDVNEENTIEEPKKQNKAIATFINILAITLLISGGYGIKFTLDQKRDIEESKIKQQELLASQQKQAEALRKKQEEKENKTNEYRDFVKLKEENPDTVGWLIVPGTTIDMPIVKTKDNTYYLTHNFDKEYNSMGWVFADYHNTFPDLSTNTIIYGHTYKRTSMFSNLKNVLENDWLNNNKKHIITFDTEKERLTFEVFSVYTIDKTNDYLYINFGNKQDHQKYLDKEIKRSIKDFKVTPTTDDKIITLSTCYYDANKRLVVQGKLKESN